MIKIVSNKLETQIELSNEIVNLLIIENPNEYYNTVCEFIKSYNGEESEYTFWHDSNQIVFSKNGEIVLDLFSFDFFDKKIISLLYKRLQNNSSDGSIILQFNEVNAKITCLLQDIASTVDFALDYGDLTLENLFKITDLKPSKTYETLLEKIVCYINIFVELKGIGFFVFVGLRNVLSENELRQLYKHCSLVKVSLFLVESFKKGDLLENEKAVIVTNDLCEITENYEI